MASFLEGVEDSIKHAFETQIFLMNTNEPNPENPIGREIIQLRKSNTAVARDTPQLLVQVHNSNEKCNPKSLKQQAQHVLLQNKNHTPDINYTLGYRKQIPNPKGCAKFTIEKCNENGVRLTDAEAIIRTMKCAHPKTQPIIVLVTNAWTVTGRTTTTVAIGQLATALELTNMISCVYEAEATLIFASERYNLDVALVQNKNVLLLCGETHQHPGCHTRDLEAALRKARRIITMPFPNWRSLYWNVSQSAKVLPYDTDIMPFNPEEPIGYIDRNTKLEPTDIHAALQAITQDVSIASLGGHVTNYLDEFIAHSVHHNIWRKMPPTDWYAVVLIIHSGEANRIEGDRITARIPAHEKVFFDIASIDDPFKLMMVQNKIKKMFEDEGSDYERPIIKAITVTHGSSNGYTMARREQTRYKLLTWLSRMADELPANTYFADDSCANVVSTKSGDHFSSFCSVLSTIQAPESNILSTSMYEYEVVPFSLRTEDGTAIHYTDNDHQISLNFLLMEKMIRYRVGNIRKYVLLNHSRFLRRGMKLTFYDTVHDEDVPKYDVKGSTVFARCNVEVAGQTK
jgi:hypothetical protein